MGIELMPLAKALLLVVLAVGTFTFAYRVLTILRLIAAGRAEHRLDHFSTRLSYALLYIFGQSRVFRNRVTGAAHLVIFYGFLVTGVEALNLLWHGLLGQAFLPVITESAAFLWLVDVMAVLVIAAVLVSAYRRYVLRPPEVKNSVAAALVLGLILLLMVTLLLTKGAASSLNAGGETRLIDAVLADALAGLGRGQLATVRDAASWVHILLIVGFLAYIPYSKHMHLIVCPFNEFLRSLRPKGALSAANVDSPQVLGAGAFDQLEWKQLLDLFACTECGRCLQYCPAHLSGRPLSPRQMILDLKRGLLHAGNRGTFPISTGDITAEPQNEGAAVEDAIGREAIWSCTTCRACQEHCPVFIEHVDKIIEARRFLLDSEGASPALSKALEGITLLGNPQVMPPSERAVAQERLQVPAVQSAPDPEIVLWVGCAATFEPAAQEAMKALVKILKAAGIRVAMLGATEQCCGDLARRSGEEGLFQQLARRNIEDLEQLGVKKLLTSCPHCYNTLKNEYPRFGGTFSVVHEVEFILELVLAGRIALTRPFDKALAYHDPCYLGRYNDIYDAPREILRRTTTGDLRELYRVRERSLCCGGGGGQMYLESAVGTRVNRLRFAEVEQLAVPVLVTACPSCKTMMDDAARYNAGGANVLVKDIAEIVFEAMEA